ncbi:hypothetical protein HII13_001095 [Brettanomyces bruxellensis]|nr:hypothetical protein HII13_001095 [Brettanomyces bruxellensis]
MFVGILGTLGSGIQDVAEFLVNELSFRFLALKNKNLDVYQHLDVFKFFETAKEMQLYATKRWSENFVMIADMANADLDLFLKRPFFLLISVDGPLTQRFTRYQQCISEKSVKEVSLAEFIVQSEEKKYADDLFLLRNLDRANIKLINQAKDQASLFKELRELDIKNPERLRPAWDEYFMSLANLAAHRANCMKRRVGCVIIRDKRVIATGYNGTPRNFKNCNEGGCPRCNSADASGVGLSTCLCLHAEENALLEAGRDRIGSSATVYCNTCPCLTCSIKIIQAGVREVVYSQSYSMDALSSRVLKQSGVTLRQFIPPKSGIVIIK